MAKRTQKEAAETRQNIMTEALNLFSKRGYMATTFEDIASKIGLTKGAVYGHFKVKTDLLAALIIEEHTLFDPMRDIDVADFDGLFDCFYKLAHQLVTDARSRKFFSFISNKVEWTVALHEELCQRLEGVLNNPNEKIKQCVARLQDAGFINNRHSAEEWSAILLGGFFGLMRKALSECEGEIHNVESMTKTMLEMLKKEMGV